MALRGTIFNKEDFMENKKENVYEITEQQKQDIITVLAEFPAKNVFNAVLFLTSLKPVELPEPQNNTTSE